jgi:hypothetical protein
MMFNAIFKNISGSQFYWWRKPGISGPDRMVVGFTTTYAIGAYHH